jgi:hypothetical protein
MTRKDGVSTHKYVFTRKERLGIARRDIETKKYMEMAKLESEVAKKLKELNLIENYEEDRDGIWIKWSELGKSKLGDFDELIKIIDMPKSPINDVRIVINTFAAQVRS